jgi:hypothetical protein
MLKLFEFMLPQYIGCIEKYITSNANLAWKLRIGSGLKLLSDSEYQLTVKKRRSAVNLLREMKALQVKAAMPSLPRAMPAVATDEMDENLLPERANSEDFGTCSPIAFPTPLMRAMSADYSTSPKPVIGLNTPDGSSAIFSRVKRMQTTGNLLSVSSASNINNNVLDQFYELILKERKFANQLLGVPRLHAKGSYNDLIKVIKKSIAYLYTREVEVYKNLEEIGALQKQHLFQHFGRDYRASLLLIVEKILCLINFDKILYTAKHCDDYKKQYYALSGIMADCKINIASLEAQLWAISDEIYDSNYQSGKPQYMKIYFDYERAAELLLPIKTPAVNDFLKQLVENKTALVQEFAQRYPGQNLKEEVERAIMEQKMIPVIGDTGSEISSMASIPGLRG